MTGSRLLVAGLVLLLAPAGGATGTRVAAKPLVKNVNGWITALAMDGPRVAYATQAFAPTNCFKVFVWNVSARTGTIVSGPATGRCGSDEPHGQLVPHIAIAGDRVAWIRTISGNTETDEHLFAATLPKPRETRLASAVRTGSIGSGPLQGGWIGGLVGSGSVLAVDTWSTDASGSLTKASLNQVGAKRLTPIASGPLTLLAEAADAGRIAVARADGTVALYSASGRLVRAVVPSSLGTIALRKDYLAVLTKTRTLEIYNSQTGAFIRSWPVPAGAANLDVFSGVAVYSVYRRLYGLQLATGKRVVLAAEKRAIVAAQIERPGVVYAFNTVKGIRDLGNIVLLPLGGVVAALS